MYAEISKPIISTIKSLPALLDDKFPPKMSSFDFHDVYGADHESLNGQSMYCYSAYQLDYWLVNSWGQSRQCSTLLYSVDHKGPDVILGMPGLSQLQILLDPAAGQWRFDVNASKLRLDEPASHATLCGRQVERSAVCKIPRDRGWSVAACSLGIKDPGKWVGAFGDQSLR